MRHVQYIVLHCTAAQAQQKTSDIIAYWKQKLGWNAYGYHWLVGEDGTAEQLTPDEKIANGVKGFNSVSIHISYKGGFDGTDTRTPEQKETLLKLVTIYKAKYPHAEIVGHRDLSPDMNGDGIITPNEWVKLCPCFSPKEEYKNVGLIV